VILLGNHGPYSDFIYLLVEWRRASYTLRKSRACALGDPPIYLTR